MMIIGCDYHPSWQQICWVDTTDGGDGRKEAGSCVGRSGASFIVGLLGQL